MKKVPDSVVEKISADIIKYKKEHGKMSDHALAKHVGVFVGQISKWRTKMSRPTTDSILKLVSAGVTDVELPAQRRAKAIQTKLLTIDKGNKVPRVYKRRVFVPPIVANQLKLIVGEYMTTLMNEPKTYQEFQDLETELIRKVYYLCRQ